MIWELAQERYPDGDLFEIVYNQVGDGLREEVNNYFDQLIIQSFANANLYSFSIFGLNHEDIEKLNTA